MKLDRLGILTPSSPASVHLTFTSYAKKRKLAAGISMATLLLMDRNGLATGPLSATVAMVK